MSTSRPLLIALLLFLFSNLNVFGQEKLIQNMAENVCSCLEKVESQITTDDEFGKKLTSCILNYVISNMDEIEEAFSETGGLGDTEAMRALGMEVGKRLIDVCPTTVAKWMSEQPGNTEKSTSPEPKKK
ncbi:MAG: hypothetical protein EA358_09980 [Flavobacteriales bacterium]|nr:MAG: hypothetical protein EA358_09980 [Flavobacteriales bacterium]